VNQYVYDVLALVHKHLPIRQVVSGGQSGADLAGLVAAVALDIQCSGTWPKGYKMRFEDGKDVDVAPMSIKLGISDMVSKIEKVEP